ncbi:12457_t:CDS:1, partial [Acaulospora colombiana]
ETSTSAEVRSQASESTGSPSVIQEDSITAVQAGPSVPRPLAVSLSARQLLNQRLQKYKLPAMFRADPVGPADNQRWKGTFWIKDTLIGASKLERSKAQAKEGAALSAIKWMNTHHYY